MVDPRPRRAFLKMQHPDWKEKLRQKCLERIQDNRGRLLWKTRTNGKKVVIQKEAMECALRDIVSDELRRIWQTPSVNKTPCLSTSEAHDSIWEYNGPNLELGLAEREPEVLDEEIMIEMDKVLHEQLESEISQRELEDMERLHEEEDDYLAQAVYEQMQLDGQGEEDGKVWCPICKEGEVQENRRFIYCTCCNLLFDNLSDQVNLNVLRHRLAEVHAVHLDRGCKAVPKFTMETKFNLSALYIYCQACNTFEIVL